jgi:hypothetical protein
MFKRVLISCVVVLVSMVALTKADDFQTPTDKGPLSASEKTFVASIQADLGKRFAHASDAEKAGYIRYTGIDDTGAISYANLKWTSTDITHPSQLWYDKNGNLLGADFSTPDTTDKRPNLFGVNPGRWWEFNEHVHYVLKTSTGMTYDHYIMAPMYIKAGGDPKHPTAGELVKMKKAKSTAEVVTVFDFPKVWDLIVWVKPNPKGAFAYKNPLVKT